MRTISLELLTPLGHSWHMSREESLGPVEFEQRVQGLVDHYVLTELVRSFAREEARDLALAENARSRKELLDEASARLLTNNVTSAYVASVVLRHSKLVTEFGDLLGGK